MKNFFTTLFFFSSFAAAIHGQSLKVDNNGKFIINAQTGQGIYTPEVQFSSSTNSVGGFNGGFNLYNTDITNNNWTRFNFLTRKTDYSMEDFANIGVQFLDHTKWNESAAMHFIMYSQGVWKSRFTITPSPINNGNYARFYFNAGRTSSAEEGVYLDNTGPANEPTFYPTRDNYGYVGSPSNQWYRAYIKMAYFQSAPSITSDYREKANIEEIPDSALTKLCGLSTISYKMKSENNNAQKRSQEGNEDEYDEFGRKIFDRESDSSQREKDDAKNRKDKNRKHFGLVAQEVKEIFPEIVDYDEEQDRYSIRYTELIPVLIQAMREQQDNMARQEAMIEDLVSEIEMLKNERNTQEPQNLSPKGPKADNEENSNLTEKCVLFQNIPNPFNQTTTIQYQLPAHIKHAKICIYNLNGKQLKSYDIREGGNGSLTIYANDLDAGMYLYTLIVNHQPMDTKRMILTE